ncbi:alpha/beta fold hydrolase [uncultured Piscinibacter sp.]|uniref:alpha/beta fold hydrolase n=1 Tax=uncultured Piscinibacter sp. TaxID=1131835 RepID=UPI00260FAB6F|nr:alpha/beta fold hydrolase [uncultured Piscinibacter sp.]
MSRSTASPAIVRYCSTADGVRIAFEQLGSGPPIVKSANWMSHLDEDRDSPLWRHWLDLLTDGRQLTRFDGRGFGLSEREPAELSFDGMVADMESVVDAARLERFPILGFCHGGPLAIAYAARHPERVSALLLCGTYAQGRAVRNPSPQDAAERELLLQLIALGWGQDSPAYRQVFATRAIPQASGDALSAYCHIQRASATPQQAQRLTRLFWHIDVSDLLPQLSCPVLVLHARRDDLVPFAQGQLLAQRIAGARLVALDSANHDLMADEPAWPVLAEAMRSFLAEHAGAAVRRDGRDLAVLTARERDVIEHVARGLDNEEIAAALYMSEKTVRNHVTAIFAKLDFSSRGRLIVWARDAGLGRDPA